MIGVIWKLILGGLWRPLLAVLGAAGLYAKGRSDAKAKAEREAVEALADAMAQVAKQP